MSGIVRRMDELGRIVIPKEMRRSMRLGEGDEMEIFSEGDNLVVRKHSRLDGSHRTAARVVGALADSTQCALALISAGYVVAVGGGVRKEAVGRSVTENLERLSKNRTQSTQKCAGKFALCEGVEVGCDEVAAFPIATHGDVVGALLVCGQNLGAQQAFFVFAAEVIAAVYAE